MNRSKSSLILAGILFVILLPLFLILLSAVITFVVALFWIIVLTVIYKTHPRFQRGVKILALITLISLIIIAIFRG